MPAGIKFKCKKCGDVVQSMHRHDFKWCKGMHFFVDGGDSYLRSGGDFEAMERLPDGPEPKKAA